MFDIHTPLLGVNTHLLTLSLPLPLPISTSVSTLDASSVGSLLSEAAALLPTQQSTSVHSYARPLSKSYAKPWLEAQHRTLQASESAYHIRELESEVNNTVRVYLWSQVCLLIHDMTSSNGYLYTVG